MNSQCEPNAGCPAEDLCVVAAVAQRAARVLSAGRLRTALRKWHQHALDQVAEREALAFCEARAQETLKYNIAARFHRVWQLHGAFHTWLETSRAAAKAAAAAAADEAAIAAKMHIAVRFRAQYVRQAAFIAWRDAVAAERAVRALHAQRCRMQGRIDAVLQRVRGTRTHPALADEVECAGDGGASPQNVVTAVYTSAKSTSTPDCSTHDRVCMPDQMKEFDADFNVATGEEAALVGGADGDAQQASNGHAGFEEASSASCVADDVDAVPFMDGIQQVTAALTESMRAAQRMACHTGTASGAVVDEGSAAALREGSADARELASSSALPGAHQRTAHDVPDIATCVRSDPSTTQRPVPAGSTNSREGCSVQGSVQQSGSADAQPSAKAHQSQHATQIQDRRRAAPAVTRRRSDPLEASSSESDGDEHCHGAQSAGGQAAAPMGSQTGSVRLTSQKCAAAPRAHGHNARQADEGISECVSGLLASRPPPDDAPWEDYVAYLEHQLLLKDEEGTTAASVMCGRDPPLQTRIAASCNKGQERAGGADGVLAARPRQGGRVSGKEAREAAAAHLARIQKAAGVRCSRNVYFAHWRAHRNRRRPRHTQVLQHLLITLESAWCAVVQARSSAGRARGNGGKRRACSKPPCQWHETTTPPV